MEFSPGGSDDGSGVVILLELLTNLVMDPSITFSQVHLIVLFTTAEEMTQNGAQAFIDSHPWKSNVRRFINLDSTGGHEKAILFRVKPSQVCSNHFVYSSPRILCLKLIQDYRHVPRPHANVIGDEILDYIDSETDYSVFTSRGSLLGYDFAFYLDGYNYHTSLDQPSIVEQGALQHLGDNTLVLARNILLEKVNLQQPEAITDEDNIIYFDILGRHLVTYRRTTAVIIQSILIGLIIFIGLTIIIVDHIWSRRNPSIDDFASIYFYFEYPLLVRLCSILIFFFCYLFSMILTILFTVLMAFILSKFRPMSWYGNGTLAFFLYGLFCLIGMILCEILWTFLRRWVLLKYSKKNPMELNTIHHIDRLYFNFERHWSLLLVFVMLMSVSIYVSYRSLYLILLWAIFICPIYLLIMLLEFIFRWSRTKYRNLFNELGWYWLFAPYIVSLVPLIHTLEMTSRLVRLAIPKMARVSHSIPFPQDLIISSLVALPTIIFCLVFIPNAQRMMNYGRTLFLLTVSCLIVLIIACVRQPYTSTHPRILHVRHQSHSHYELNDPQVSPLIIPIHSQNATITVESFDNHLVSSVLDRFSSKTGHSLNGRSCLTPSKCSFDDSFNRTLAFEQVELTSTDGLNNYQFTIRHLPSYQITVTPSFSIAITVHDATVKPRTETIVDVQLIDSTISFRLQLTIERCDLNDSPFLLSLTKTFPSIVLWGTGRCQTLTDTLLLIWNKS